MSFKRIFFGILILTFFTLSIYYSFCTLLEPTDSLNSKTLYSISNPYTNENSSKGIIYDCNNVPLLANIVIDSLGEPIYDEDGSYRFISEVEDLDSVSYSRRIIDSENSYCWSNILTEYSGGLDSSFANILQDIPLNSDDSTDIVLTIDNTIQSDTYDALSERNYSSAIVLDCNNGNVISMVSKPSYDYNSFRNGTIPYTYSNTDNSHDCVQDYYKLWKSAYQQDNIGEDNINKWVEGENVASLEQDWKDDGLMYSQENVTELDEYWSLYEQYIQTVNVDTDNKNFEDNNEIDGFNFKDIFKLEYEFYKEQEENNSDESFDFIWEPSTLGDGITYIPFVKLSDGNYLKLCYGNNNFIYEDCIDANFDPNFSFQNYAVSSSAPGSCFKILLSALLIDSVDESMLIDSDGITTVNVGNEYKSTVDNKFPAPLPTVETATQSHNNLKEALSTSSNQYFSLVAINLDRILKSTNSYSCTYEDTISLSEDELYSSGSLLLNYYKDKFCINTKIGAYFSVEDAKILSCLDDILVDTTATEQDKDLIYDSTLWYDLDDDGNVVQAYTNSTYSLAQKIGDTAYGQGYDRISPMYMAMAMGKCLTGTMYVPNILADETEPRTIGEDFNRSSTVDILSDNLQYVYDSHTNDYGAYFDFPSNFVFYSKTGTSSVDKGKGTQSTYGLFADKINYPTQTDSSDKYQTIWYVGGVTDGENTYSIVLRSFFDDNSYSLKKEFLTIVNSLYENGYLNEY